MNAKIYEKRLVMSGIIGIKKDNELLKSLILDWRNYSLTRIVLHQVEAVD